MKPLPVSIQRGILFRCKVYVHNGRFYWPDCQVHCWLNGTFARARKLDMDGSAFPRNTAALNTNLPTHTFD